MKIRFQVLKIENGKMTIAPVPDERILPLPIGCDDRNLKNYGLEIEIKDETIKPAESWDK